MKFLWIDYITDAYHSLRSNRTRSVLTTTGIAIGIASITCILALSSGVSKMMFHEIEEYNGDLTVVRPGLQTKDPNALTNPVAQQSFSTSTLTEDDVNNIADIKGVEASVPVMTINGTLKSSTETIKDHVVLATTPNFVKVSEVKMKHGQFLGEETDNSTAVVGYQLAIDLFGTDNPISANFTIRGQTFTVIGVIKQVDSAINFNNIDINNTAVVSFEQGKQFHQSRAQIQQIDVLISESADVEKVNAEVEKRLLTAHSGENDFSVTTGKDISQPTNQLYIALTQVMTAIAAISLFVGGIGIMNIMLVGVAERTREIGIRKAVGASNGNIVMQFLVESLTMSLVGGLIGYGLGYVLAFSISTVLYFNPAFTWEIAAIAFGMALLVGLLFGLYPAARAARKDTIQSLRQYY